MKLNLGAGKSANEYFTRGYVNIDRTAGPGIQQGDVYPLGFPDGSAEEILCSHILEHFSHRDAMAVLTDWVRVLKPGGVLKIAVPDFEYIARKYVAFLDDGGEQINLQGYAMGGQTDENDYHKCLFDRTGLTEAMKRAGLVDIAPWTSEVRDCASLPVSLNLQGRKPGNAREWLDSPADAPHPDAASWFMASNDTPTEPDAPQNGTQEQGEPVLPADTILFKPETIGCVLSVPRLGFMSNMQCLLNVSSLGVQVRTQQGAFWGQCLTDAILQFLEKPEIEYVLTVDYDSIFTAEDVLRLYQIMASPGSESIDALASVQVRRENDAILLTMADAEGKARPEVSRTEMEQDVVRVRTAHFGLTLFRAAALRALPHPWFLDVPDPDGKWGEGKIDCDIQFWAKWGAAGLSLYLAPRVVIGHMEAVISWPDKGLRTTMQRMSHYQRDGKPKDAWT